MYIYIYAYLIAVLLIGARPERRSDRHRATQPTTGRRQFIIFITLNQYHYSTFYSKFKCHIPYHSKYETAYCINPIIIQYVCISFLN